VVASVVASALITAGYVSAENRSAKAGDETVTLSIAESGANVELSLGRRLVVRLTVNRTTGYSWSLVESANALLKVDGASTYEPARSERNVVGTGGTEVWTFAPLRAGQQDLRFEYRRAWEPAVAPAQVVTYTVIVR
jgi:predicted secreted protein